MLRLPVFHKLATPSTFPCRIRPSPQPHRVRYSHGGVLPSVPEPQPVAPDDPQSNPSFDDELEEQKVKPARLSAEEISALHKSRWRDFKRLVAAVLSTLFLQRDAAHRAFVGVRLSGQLAHLAASVTFVVLYVWSTYQAPTAGSLRANLDIALSIFFAINYFSRIVWADSWQRAILDPMNILDFLSFAPSLLEVWWLNDILRVAHGTGIDLRWFRVFRAVRVLRLLLLTGNLRLMKSSRNALLSGVVNVRLMQLVASILALLFTSASLVHLAERMPWHEAFYFVTTTITTVGFGDVVCRTVLGRTVVVVMMVVGVVMIPVRASQLYTQLLAGRDRAGALPRPGRPFVLVSTRMSEVRAFSDLFSEFFAQLVATRVLPADTLMVCVSNKPTYEFAAFQELNESKLTVIEGSVLSENDLMTCRAQQAEAVIVLGDRFTSDADQEDLDLLFRVWAIKGYTKCVPLHVQCLRAASIAKIAPFLDPINDSVSSIELTRHQLLALSCLCPGASTLVSNLFHTAQLTPEMRDDRAGRRDAQGRKARLAGQVWLAEYTRGCGHGLYVTAAGAAMAGLSFSAAAEVAFRLLHVTIMGALGDPDNAGVLVLNPAFMRLQSEDRLLVLATSQAQADEISMLKTVAVAAGAAAAQATTNGAGREAGAASPRMPTVMPRPAGMAAGGLAALMLSVDDERDTSYTPYRGAEDYGSYGGGGGDGGGGGGPLLSRTASSSPSSVKQRLASLGLQQSASMQASWPTPRTKGMPYRDEVSQLQGHVILSGLNENFVAFARILQCSAGQGQALPMVVLQPEPLPDGMLLALGQHGPVYVVKGSPNDAEALKRANASSARCLVYMGNTDRPTQGIGHNDTDYGSTTRMGVLTDAEALLTCYGVGESQSESQTLRRPVGAVTVPGSTRAGVLEQVLEDSGLQHAVVELSFTSSVRFLQPGLLLQGASPDIGLCNTQQAPRVSWLRRRQQEEEALNQGLIEWQVNAYYCAGRVTVPAVMDTFTCQAFFKRNLLSELMTELCGSDGRPGGAMLRQIPVPADFVGKTYSQLFTQLSLVDRLIPLGLYRSQREAVNHRLPYVYVNPGWNDIVHDRDRVFVLRRPWLEPPELA